MWTIYYMPHEGDPETTDQPVMQETPIEAAHPREAWLAWISYKAANNIPDAQWVRCQEYSPCVRRCPACTDTFVSSNPTETRCRECRETHGA